MVVEVTVEGGLIGLPFGSTVRVVILVMVFWGGVMVMILVVRLCVIGLGMLALGMSVLPTGVDVFALRVLTTVLVF